MLTPREVNNWLGEYGNAWKSGDFEGVTSLFAEDAIYHEDPFEKPMKGHNEIRQYWKDGATDAQEDVTFQFTLWSIDDAQCFAHWHATFTRIKTRERVKLDGVFRLKLRQSGSDIPVCTSLQEWWHRRQD